MDATATTGIHSGGVPRSHDLPSLAGSPVAMFSVDVMAGFYAGRRRQVNAQLAPSQTSALWFFLCLTGTPGNIANTTHVVGLVLGTTWGFFSSLRAQLGL